MKTVGLSDESGGVAEETAYEIFSRARGGGSLFPLTGMPPLDLLRENQRNNSKNQTKIGSATNSVTHQQTNASTITPSQLKNDSLRDIIEVSGLSQSGKTELVLRAVATCVLPRSLELEDGQVLQLGGEDGSVVFFDSDLRLNSIRLAGIIAAPLERACKNGLLSQDKATEVAQACLEKVLIYRCPGSLQVLATIHSLTTEFLRHENVKLIIFDSISTFYWQDLETDPVSAGFHVSIPLAIQQLAKRHIASIMCVKPCLYRPRGSNRSPEYLSQTWQKLVTLKLYTECLDGQSQFRLSHIGTAEGRVFDFTIEHSGLRITS